MRTLGIVAVVGIVAVLAACQNTSPTKPPTTRPPPTTLPDVAGTYYGTRVITIVAPTATVESAVRFVVTQDQDELVISARYPSPEGLKETGRYTGTLVPDGRVVFHAFSLPTTNCGPHFIESHDATIRDDEFHWKIPLSTELCGPVNITINAKRIPT